MTATSDAGASVPAAASSAAGSTAAGAAASGNAAAAAGYTSATTVSTVADLREKAPQVWNAMLLGIAQNICSESQHHADRLKELMQEARSQNGG